MNQLTQETWNLLRDRHNHRLMVSSCNQGTKPVEPSLQTAGNGICQAAIPIASIINSLEVSESSRIWWCTRREAISKVLDGNLTIV